MSEQERAHGQHAQSGRQGANRADGRHAERVEAEQHGGDEAQDPSNSRHAPGVPERSRPQTTDKMIVFGACTCVPQPETADGCRCEFRQLIDRLLVTAYHCDPETAVERLRELIKDAPAILSDAQDKHMVRLAATWTGSPAAFAKRHGYTRQRLHQMGVRWRSRKTRS